MRQSKSLAALISLGLLGACAAERVEDVKTGDVGGDSGDVGGGSDNGSGAGNGSDVGTDPVASCPLGAATFTTLIGATDVNQKLDLAVAASGDVMLGAAGAVNGVSTLSASGSVLSSLPYGSRVAIDASGNRYIAGAFTERLELANGLVLEPTGSGPNVFVLKLNANGDIVFAKSLGVCGSHIDALAVAADGRIAISGSVFGTLILDGDGNVLLRRTDFGHLAFTSQGNLVIAGSERAFVRSVDADGTLVFDHVLGGSGAFTGVAVDATDRVVVVGNTDSTIDLLGSPFTAMYDSGIRIAGAFAIQLDAAGDLEYSTPLYINVANAVTYSPDGFAYVAAETSGFVNGQNETSGQLLRIDSNVSITSFGIAQLFRGTFNDIAADACGGIILAGAGYQDPTTPHVNALVFKVAP